MKIAKMYDGRPIILAGKASKNHVYALIPYSKEERTHARNTNQCHLQIVRCSRIMPLVVVGKRERAPRARCCKVQTQT